MTQLDITPIDAERNVVRLTGRLDAPGVDQIEMRFTAGVAAANRHAVIDLSGVDFLASMGIRMFIAVARAMHAKGCRIALFGASEAVQDVLEAVALDQIIPVTGTEQQALQAIAA
jgi:anti-anti-sigma factor